MKVSRPDIFIVVLDCVRYPDFPLGGLDSLALPAAGELMKDSVLFPLAITVAPWTIPAHDSLLSGRYFWNVMRSESPRGSNYAGLSRLSNSGYHSAAFLANPILDSLVEVRAQFDNWFIAPWWDPFLPLTPGANGIPWGGPVEGLQKRDQESGLRQALESLCLASLRYPVLLETVAGFIDRLSGARSDSPPIRAPWIEAKFDSWLSTQSEDSPIFALVNLNDAHEPYLRGGSESGPDPSAGSQRRSRQDRIGWLLGRWEPTSSELRFLHDLYWRQLRLLDLRLKTLLEVIRARRSYEDAIVVVTSDHGQAFGEGGMMFHSQRVDESLLRVPLIMKWPSRLGRSGEAIGWASSIDVMPTILESGAGKTGVSLDGVSLFDIMDRERDHPVFAVSTGINPLKVDAVTPRRRQFLDGIRTAGYLGRWKCVTDAGGTLGRFEEVGATLNYGTGTKSASLGPPELLRSTLAISDRLSMTGRARDLSSAVSDRLATWGY